MEETDLSAKILSDYQIAHTVVIGGGPAGLMAAETILNAGRRVSLYDGMPSIGRKFLMAGKGGLNLTHSERFEKFISRYGDRQKTLKPIIESFTPTNLRDWAQQLGFATFVGSSGRVFPEQFNSVPILRAWLSRLKTQGLEIHTRHRWAGWDDHFRLYFETPEGNLEVQTPTVLLALGGGSWSRLGSDGSWVSIFEQKGLEVRPFEPANCGFEVKWSDRFRESFSGKPVKPVVVKFIKKNGEISKKKGEFIITENGVEGSAIYAISAHLREEIKEAGCAFFELDLAPDWTLERLVSRLSMEKGSRSISTHLKKSVGIFGLKAGLLWETLPRDEFDDPARLAAAIKGTRIRLDSTRPLDEAISSAGGVPFELLDQNLMIKNYPGMFCAGEMLDWEAPTGGYLLTASFATGRWAGQGVSEWLNRNVST